MGINPDDLNVNDVHLHVLRATPKDRPSAGITMLMALVSLFTGRKVSQVSYTGEITLRGKVLAVVV